MSLGDENKKNNNKKVAYLFLGVLLGILLGFFASKQIYSRYEIISGGPQGIFVNKIDKWSGETWIQRYYEADQGGKQFYWDPVE